MSSEDTILLPNKITPSVIEDWALSHPTRALELGKRLVKGASDPESIQSLDSLGEDEDRLITWAQDHKMIARITLIKLLPKIAKAKAQADAETQTETKVQTDEPQSSVV